MQKERIFPKMKKSANLCWALIGVMPLLAGLAIVKSGLDHEKNYPIFKGIDYVLVVIGVVIITGSLRGIFSNIRNR